MVRPDNKMNFKFGPLLLTLALVASAAAGGAWVGARLLQPQAYTHEDFHDRLFAKLSLTDAQRELMETLEQRHADENEALESRLADANRKLADLLEREAAYSDNIDGAIEDFHRAMLAYQKTSVRHIYEMREILDPAQRDIFDSHVAETLREYAN
jgi:nickel and cobalt resistance protein CnrR